MLLSNCNKRNQNNASGEIIKINSKIILSEKSILIKNEVEFSTLGSPVSFYIPKFSKETSIEIYDALGSRIPYNIEDNEYGFKLTIKDTENKIKLLNINYNINLNLLNPSRNYYSDNNQLFLLPDIGFLPRQTEFPNTQLIEFRIKIENLQTKYSYIYENKQNLFFSPYILMGNFQEFDSPRLSQLCPNNIKVDSLKINNIGGLITDSYNYFSKIFGSARVGLKDIKIFYLNRSGGHGFSEGLILDQNYINLESENKDINMPLIVHEVAHLWWGNSVTSENSSLMEGLAEYSSDIFMTNCIGRSSSDIYGKKNLEFELSKNKPVNFYELTPMSQGYKSYSYKKLPIILRELELKLGEKELLYRLQSLYLEIKESDKPIFGYNNLSDLFGKNLEINEFESDISGNLKNWPDFYIKNVKNNTVLYAVDNIFNDEILPVTIIDDNENVYYDTLSFTKKNSLIEKIYKNNVLKVVIDDNFYLNQSIASNDVFVVDKDIDLDDSKYPKFYKSKYYKFANKLIHITFYNEPFDNHFIQSVKDQTTFLNAPKELKKLNASGYSLFIDEKKSYFKIGVIFKHNGKTIQGFIDGEYAENDGTLYLKSLETINL